MTNPRDAVYLTPDDALGQPLHLLGYELLYKLRGESTQGRLAVCEFRFTAGSDGPPLHTDDHDELFIVESGEMRFQIADRVVSAPAGTTVFAPEGVLHTFGTTDAGPSRCLTLFSPAGFERFFEEAARLIEANGGLADRAQLLEVAGRLGTKYVGPPLWRQ